jgi:hypothetical protein
MNEEPSVLVTHFILAPTTRGCPKQATLNRTIETYPPWDLSETVQFFCEELKLSYPVRSKGTRASMGRSALSASC